MKIQLRLNEKITREGGANMQKGLETVGGRLYLTNQRLHFQSHALNIQTGSHDIELHDITNTELTWTKFLGAIPLFPNSLSVTTAQGLTYSFVLYGRSKWAKAIHEQMNTDLVEK